VQSELAMLKPLITLLFLMILVFLMILAGLSLPWGPSQKAVANGWSPNTSGTRLAARWSSLIVKANSKKHCQKVFVCYYFAPATSCSSPPCCKKGHKECAENAPESSNSGANGPSGGSPTLPSPFNERPRWRNHGCFAMARPEPDRKAARCQRRRIQRLCSRVILQLVCQSRR